MQKNIIDQLYFDLRKNNRKGYVKIFNQGVNLWKKIQPKVDKIVQATTVISTATSTLKVSIQITPICLTIFTALATAPFFGILLPHFLFDPALVALLVVGISAFAGYHKYRELIVRAQLDHQIECNTKLINLLNKKFKRLENKQFTKPDYFSQRYHLRPSIRFAKKPDLYLKLNTSPEKKKKRRCK